MLDLSQYEYQARHQQLQQDYRDSAALQQALVKRVHQASNQIGIWLVKIGKYIETQTTTPKLQGQS